MYHRLQLLAAASVLSLSLSISPVSAAAPKDTIKFEMAVSAGRRLACRMRALV